ncbi:hypothetical protein KP509_20G033900 [Ceratopteris richardii]|uniref:EF-hand domain-containing protein n=1 Tax=Ceratopteris richardii TaxID=49495 RepID=A0A8T2SGH7_CERRI|nr:hypothetical protein KP509_20G033900 [Ceratopteris richardii]
MKFDGNCEKESMLMRNSSDSLGDESKYATIQTHGDEDLVDAFNVFDKDRNGLISANELRSVLISLGFSQEACAIEACTAMIARVDKNGDAHVDLCEFTSLLRLECHHDSCGILAL